MTDFTDFYALVEEMKKFYGVSSLEAVAEKLGYARNTAVRWRYYKKLSAHAQLKWLEAKKNRKPEIAYNTIEEGKTMDSAEFKELRAKIGFTQEQLAKELALSARQVANYESGKTPIKPFVERQLKTLVDDILGNNVTSDKTLTTISSSTSQPLAYSDSLSINANYYPDISVSAGYGLAIFGKIEATPINIPTNLLGNIVGLDLKKQYDALRVVGDSMLPYIHDGELALIERTEIAQNGNVVVAHVGEDLFIKYFERHPLGKWVKLRSHNKEYSDIELVGDEIDMLRIVGVLRATISVKIKVF